MKQYKKMSVVVTVKNDESGVQLLKEYLHQQTRKPDEVIVIRAEDYKNCTRAEGRNIGIRKAKFSIIAVTDVGCRPHRDWLEKLIAPIEQGEADAVAGFYLVRATTPFQQAITPYLAVLPHQFNNRYLPASRSIAFTKKAWELVRGYPEEAKSAGEDLVFARTVSNDSRIRMVRVSNALVDWEPPKTILEYFHSIVQHTRSNFEAHIAPHMMRNLTIPLRWIVFLFIPLFIPLYLVWPMWKHKMFSMRAMLLLPIIQLTTDAAITAGIMSLWVTNMMQ